MNTEQNQQVATPFNVFGAMVLLTPENYTTICNIEHQVSKVICFVYLNTNWTNYNKG